MSVHTSKVFRKGPLETTKRNLKEKGWGLWVAALGQFENDLSSPVLSPTWEFSPFWAVCPNCIFELSSPQGCWLLSAQPLCLISNPFFGTSTLLPQREPELPHLCTFWPAKWGLQFVSAVYVTQNEFKLPNGPEGTLWILRADGGWREGVCVLKKPRKASWRKR